MHRLLIPLIACFFIGAPSILRAQVPLEIQYAPYDPQKVKPVTHNAEVPCGNAGTITFGQFIGSSNDVAPAPIFLCFGDSLLIQHNGDADLSGDPVPGTPAGVGLAFYECPPTVTGPTLQDVIGAGIPPTNPDPCLLLGSMNGLYITQAIPNGGSTWFFNSGALQTTFNSGQPLSLFFAPITVDNLATNGYESLPASAPGPCVAVSTAAAFEVVYLNQITATGIDNNFGNDCLGRFTIRGGFPQYENTALYNIQIFLTSNPSVKAIVHTAATQLFHLSSVAFSVPVAGNYTVVVEDGKSCPATFTIDMNLCNAADNMTLIFPDTIVPPGNNICVPITVENFDIFSAQFSVEWDETVLLYNGLQNINPILSAFFSPGASLNENETPNGRLGVIIVDNLTANAISIPDGETLFEICFTAIGQLGDCSGIGITNFPTGVSLEDAQGANLAISVDTGEVCISFLPLGFTYEVIDTNCLGQATLVITPSGGVPPYDIIIDETNGPTYSTLNGTIVDTGIGEYVLDPVGNPNNTPVTYEICVTDNNGLGATRCTTLVVNIPRLGAQINFAQQPLCNGGSTGIISAVVLEGGVVVPMPGTNYNYQWAPAGVTVQGSQVQNNVPAGPYFVTITNTTTGCSEAASGTLGQPAPISRELSTITPASCSGVCDGVISYEAEGGVPFAGPAYQYTWTYVDTNTPVGSGTDNPIGLAGACSGEYSLLITDANGCTFTDDNIVVNNLRNLSLVRNNVTNVLCNGESSGSITLTVNESVVTGNIFNFFWTPTGFTQTGTSPSSTYSNLPAGEYAVLASDNLGCQVVDTIIITQLDSIRIDSFGQVNPGCAQPNSGSVSIAVFGGTGFGTYGFAWSPAPPAIAGTQNQFGLPFGTYTVVVSDANNCTATRSFFLPEPSDPDVTITQIPVRCGSDGSLTATSPTGLVYSWTDINGVVIGATQTISSLAGGDYIIRVIDATGCFAIDTITLAGVTPLSFSDTTLTQPRCFGSTNGQIAIGVQDGQPPYVSYAWEPQPQPNQSVIFNLSAGTYTVTVTDNVGCTLVGIFVLDQPPAILSVFDPTVLGRVSCFGECDGAATPIVVYDTNPPTFGNFNFLWSDGSTDSLRTDLCAGINSVIITDADNCFTTDTINITTPPQISANITTTETFCFGDNTGTATAVATGGNGGPYSYLWNTMAVTPGITNVPAGNYTLTITDVANCTNSIIGIVIGQPDPIVLITSTTNPACFGGETGQASVDVMGGVGPYAYNWEDFMGNNVGNGDLAEMLFAGTYIVTVTDANGCSSVNNATIQDPPPVMGDYEDLDPLNCFGDETILSILTISGGSGGPYRFSVDFGAVLDPNFPVSIGGGEHFITYIDVKDCAITETIFVPEPAPITVVFNPNVIEVELGETADLEPIISGAAVISNFVWTNPETLLDPTVLNATAYSFNNVTYTLTVVDSFGCSGVGSVTVNIDPNRNVYIPNIFIPANPNGLNDHFNVNVGLGVETVNFMRVYDRWGELMYEREGFFPDNDNFGEGWDGRFNGKFVNPGVYVYLIEVRFLDERVLLYRGDVTVVR